MTRSFNVADLYTRWLGTEPDYSVLSDFSDPQQVLSSPSPYMRPPMNTRMGNERETLRGQFVLPEDTVSILLVNGEGNIVHIEPDAQAKLAQTLAKIKDLMQGE